MIDIKNLTLGYGKTKILKNLSLSFKKGELTGIIGPNGSGKTTALKAVLGILPVTSGDIFIDGENISNLKRIDAAKRIAYLSQGNKSPDMTVGELVLHGRFPYLKYPHGYSEADKREARLAMAEMGLENLEHKLLSSLSGGMRQSAHIAMAIAQRTDYILLDEPTTYLDVSHQIKLMESMRRLSDSGKGIIAVMHELPMALSFSDNVAVLNEGELRFFGTPDELFETDIIKEVFGISLARENGEYFYKISNLKQKETKHE